MALRDEHFMERPPIAPDEPGDVQRHPVRRSGEAHAEFAGRVRRYRFGEDQFRPCVSVDEEILTGDLGAVLLETVLNVRRLARGERFVQVDCDELRRADGHGTRRLEEPLE